MEKNDQLKIASECGWEDVKKGTEKAWNKLEEAFDKTVAQFK